jgi:hypothetical protein
LTIGDQSTSTSNAPDIQGIDEYVETWFQADIRALARSLSRDYDIEPGQFAGLCEAVQTVQRLYNPLPISFCPDFDGLAKIGDRSKELLRALHDLGEADKRIIESCFRAESHITPPAQTIAAAAQDQTVEQLDHALLIEIYTLLDMRLNKAIERIRQDKPRRGAPPKTPLTLAVFALKMFWELALDREFRPLFGPDLDDLDDPDQKKLHPMNQVSKFCCTVLRTVGDATIRGESLLYAMKKVRAMGNDHLP